MSWWQQFLTPETGVEWILGRGVICSQCSNIKATGLKFLETLEAALDASSSEAKLFVTYISFVRSRNLPSMRLRRGHRSHRGVLYLSNAADNSGLLQREIKSLILPVFAVGSTN